MTDPDRTGDGFDASTYGRSFADVYDDWYQMDSDTAAAIAYLIGSGGPTQRILEVGVGTGRLAVPLALGGHDVVGMDSSAEMLAVLTAKAAREGVEIAVAEGDACEPTTWPQGPFDIVVAAYNFVFNLIGEESKLRFLRLAARSLDADGRLVVETFVPADQSPTGTVDHLAHDPDPEPAGSERRVELKEISLGSVILIASETDHTTGVVTGQHIELRDGEPVRLRPWRVQVVTPEGLDSLATRAGLVLEHRHDGWDGSGFGPESHRAISVYRRGH